MKFKMVHNNFNVLNLEKSIAFYQEALGLEVIKRKEAQDGSYILVFMGNSEAPHMLELTWLRDWDRPYNLGDNEFHLALEVDDYEEAYKKHKEMGVICFENTAMGLYFIADPDNYWIEILPRDR